MIFFLLFFVLMALILQQKMGVWALQNLSCSIRSDDYLVEPGAPFTLVLSVENRSKWPVLFLGCRCAVPPEAELAAPSRGKIVRLVRSAEYRFHCFLMPHQAIEHPIVLTLPSRGGYRFDSLKLSAGDFFGLKEREAAFPGSCEIVVAPPKPEGLGRQSVVGGLLGERSVLRWIHEDPILSAGFREYTGREPLKTVSWNRSLQSGKLMVRQMDHTAEEKVTVLFSLAKGQTEDVENCLSVCRGICEDLENQNLPYAFLHNGMLQTAVGILPGMEAGLGRQHLSRILESLGRALPYARDSLATLVRRTLAREQDSSCYLLLVPEISAEVRQAAAQLESRSGSAVRIICGGLQK